MRAAFYKGTRPGLQGIYSRADTSLHFNGHLYQLVVRGAQTPLSQIEATERYIKQKMTEQLNRRAEDKSVQVLATKIEGLAQDMSEMKHGISKMADAFTKLAVGLDVCGIYIETDY